MSIIADFLGNLFSTNNNSTHLSTITIDVPAELYYKELAIYTAASLIGDQLAKAQVKVFKRGSPVKDEDWYLLNISPNPNMTAAQFWHKLIYHMITKRNGAFVFEYGSHLYIADSWNMAVQNDIYGHTYDGITVGVMHIPETFRADDVYIFKLTDKNAGQFIDGLYADWGKFLTSAGKAFTQSNSRKYKLHIDAYKAGDEDFEKEFNEVVAEQLKEFMSKDSAVYPEFDGYKLEADPLYSTKTSSADLLALKKDLFETVYTALHIPLSVMTGTNTNVDDVMKELYTTAVDPFATAITQTLCKRGGYEQYSEGNRYKMDTSNTTHKDCFDASADASNVISSGVYCIDEVREKLGEEPLNTWWSRKHWITKNFSPIEDVLNGLQEKGETTDE